jgi:oligopeptide/dipeptide ABC transporter ATP-binding protein
VDGVSFTIKKGETHAIVGESGCGKSMTALSIMQLLPEPGGYIKSGKVLFEGKDLLDLTWTEMGGLRGEEISMIFQEPMTSLNPTLSIGNQIRETMIVHGKSKSKAQEVALDLLQRIGFDDPAQALRQYPHELSGGMRQRVMIAMALANKPKLLIADEPTTALDVTVQAQILRLLHDLQQELGMAVLLITHDLGVVAEVADSVSVMYAGKIVEESSVADLFASPHHPYAQDLLASLPSRQRRGQDLATIGGVVPDSTNWPPGCRYTERCRCRFEPCPNIEPKNTAVERSRVLCHLYDPELAPKPTVEATSK